MPLLVFVTVGVIAMYVYAKDKLGSWRKCENLKELEVGASRQLTVLVLFLNIQLTQVWEFEIVRSDKGASWQVTAFGFPASDTANEYSGPTHGCTEEMVFLKVN